MPGPAAGLKGRISQGQSPTRMKIYFADRAAQPGDACLWRFIIEMDFVGEG